MKRDIADTIADCLIEDHIELMKENESLKAELAEANKVVAAAKNLIKVKGRHNSELAMKLLIDAMQEKDE